ncbi:MAG: protein TolR [Alphaproteobacteria bacterium]|jgi:biopolymer transport protein TolR|nr:protein TolR [Alphaproteobacteria bacterium]MDP6515949.1 protein TolR [Alphaproteobacteria bacterium]
MAVHGMPKSSRYGNGRYRPMSEINVTPFVDVMLVLLVVFMVTAPLLSVGVEVDLPKAEAELIPGEDEPLTVSIDAEGKLFLQESELGLDQLVARLEAIVGENRDTRVFVRGDRAIQYGLVMKVMTTISLAGFDKVALITETPLPEDAGG